MSDVPMQSSVHIDFDPTEIITFANVYKHSCLFTHSSQHEGPHQVKRLQPMIYGLVFLSGLSALIFQITAQKYLSIYLGSDNLSSTLILSLFFLFLSLGYKVWGTYGHRFGHNFLLTYGYIELIIGLYFIAAPNLFDTLFNIFSHWEMTFFRSVALSSAFLFLPCFLMGGSLPICVQAVTKTLSDSDETHSKAYGINTIGAFIGSLICGFFLIENLGLRASLYVAGAINCLIYIIILFTKTLSQTDFGGFQPQSQQKTTISKTILSLSFLGGFSTFAFENIMIRITGLSVGSSHYAYTVIVSCFIFSIGLGAFCFKKVFPKPDYRQLERLFISTTLLTLFIYLLIPHLPDALMRLKLVIMPSEFNFKFYWSGVFISFLILLILPVASMGLNLPLLFSLHKNRDQRVNESMGSLYMYNALGAMSGAMASYGLLHFFNLSAVYKITLFSLLGGLILCSSTFRSKKQLLVGLSIGIALIASLPSWPFQSFTPARFSGFGIISTSKDLDNLLMAFKDQSRSTYLYTKDGPNGTVAVVDSPNKKNTPSRILYVNGKPDAVTGVTGDNTIRTMTALVPMSLAPKIKDVFIVGLGSGLSTGIVSLFEENQSIHTTEMSEGVIEAMPLFKKWNYGVETRMDKIKITQGDAYSTLKNSTKTYDVIMSEPSNTWVTGVEKLFTLEFLETAEKKLSNQGVYSQWFPLFAIKDESFLGILNNFQTVFENVTVWQIKGGAVIVLASKTPLSVDVRWVKKRFSEAQEAYKAIDCTSELDILGHQLMTPKLSLQLAKRSNVSHSLEFPTLAYSSAKAYFSQRNVNLQALMVSKLAEHRLKPVDASSKFLWETLPTQMISSSFLKKMHQKLLQSPSYSHIAGLHYLKWYDRKPQDKVFNREPTKMAQYQYLRGLSPPTPLPAVTTNTNTAHHQAPLYEQLWKRFSFLLSVLEPAKQERLLATIPATCPDINCYRIKLDLLRYNEALTLKNALLLSSTLNKQETRLHIETIYSRWLAK